MSFTSFELVNNSPLVANQNISFLSQFSDKKYEYDKISSFCRVKDGVELPDTSSEAVARLNLGYPWEEYGGLRLSTCRSFFVLPTEVGIMSSTIRRRIGTYDSPIRMLVPLLSIPNGQVKNFLNACRACNRVKKQSKIAVVGSKAAEGGGIWHKYFLLYLTTQTEFAIVDFFDFAEISRDEIIKQNNSTITAEWIAEGFNQSMASEYDIIIDDTWTYANGPGLGLDFNGDYSWKGTDEIDEQFQPFLHPTETRSFSSPPLEEVKTGCRCPTCRVIKECVHTYSQYLSLRYLCSRLGYVAPCEGLKDQSDLKNAGETLKNVLTGTLLDLKYASMVQSVIAISEEIPLKVTASQVRQDEDVHAVARFLPVNRMTVAGEAPITLPTYPWLEGKSVSFSGIPSSVVGGTKVLGTQLGVASSSNAPIVFLSKKETWQMLLNATIVYAPFAPASIVSLFPDWRPTGRKVSTLHEYVREEVEEESNVMIPFKQFSVTMQEKSHILFPTIKNTRASLLKGKKPYADGHFYSFLSTTQSMEMVPFDPSKWRTSIYVNKDNTWGRAVDAIEHIQDPTFLRAKVMLPWDMTRQEAQVVEQRVKCVEYSMLRSLKSQVAWSITKKYEGFDLTRLPDTGEFVKAGGLLTFTLMRSPEAHLISYPEEADEEWGLCLRHGYFRGRDRFLQEVPKLFET